METLSDLKAGPIVDRRCYTSDAIFQRELDRIFGRAWLFVAHESELSRPGDFRTSDVANQPVVAIRGGDGRIRVFFNSCRHRGALVETERRGSRNRFRCTYHHWAYDPDGRLTFVPREQGFGTDFKKEDFGLVPVAQVAVLHGMVFANLRRDAPTLQDYLGSVAPFLNEVATYEGRPLQEVGSFEFTYKGNWKLFYENTFDDYHNEYLHSRVYQSFPGFQYGQDYTGVKNTTTSGKALRVGDGANPNHVPQKLGLHSAIHWHDSAEKMHLQKRRTRRVNMAIFPSFLGVFHPVLDMTSLRIIKPEARDRTRVLNYCLAPADLSDAEKKAVAARFNGAFGPGGPIMMDDLRVFDLVQRGLEATGGGDLLVTRGLERAAGVDADDHAIRGFWDSWREFMVDGPVCE